MRNIDLFDNYLYNRQNTEDRKLFDERLASDETFKKEFDEHTAFVKLLQEYGKQQELKKQLDTVYVFVALLVSVQITFRVRHIFIFIKPFV